MDRNARPRHGTVLLVSLAGARYSRTFDTAGTFTYACGIHPAMKGAVVVAP